MKAIFLLILPLVKIAAIWWSYKDFRLMLREPAPAHLIYHEQDKCSIVTKK